MAASQQTVAGQNPPLCRAMALESLPGVMRTGGVHGAAVTIGPGYDLLKKFQGGRPERKRGAGLLWFITCIGRRYGTYREQNEKGEKVNEHSGPYAGAAFHRYLFPIF
jgi:hypothetical protein